MKLKLHLAAISLLMAVFYQTHAETVWSDFGSPINKSESSAPVNNNESVSKLLNVRITRDAIAHTEANSDMNRRVKSSTISGNVTVTKDEHGIITSVSGGEKRIYNRQGTAYINNSGSVSMITQSGPATIIEDGDVVYFERPVSQYTTGAWVAGYKEGNTYVFPAKQPLNWSSSYAATMSMRWGIFTAEGKFNVTDAEECFVFAVEGNQLVLQGTVAYGNTNGGAAPFMGVFWDDDNSFTGYGDAETVLTFNQVLNDLTITIGTGTNTSSNYPYFTSSSYSTTQSIYTSEEMGGAKSITSIGYNTATAASYSTESVKIYMGHRSKNNFSSYSDYDNVSNMTLVYSGAPILAQNPGWDILQLSTPFAYNGIDNLVVVVSKKANGAQSTKFYYSSTPSKQCLYRGGDSSNYGDAMNTNRSYDTSSNRANVLFKYDDLISQNGLVFGIPSDTTIGVIRYTGNETSITIPSEIQNDGKTYRVTYIGSSAFKGCSNLTSLTIPNSITNIGSYAFSGCTGLTSLTIPSCITTIESNTFQDCTGLTTLTIPSSVTCIGSSAFQGCTGLTSLVIPGSVTIIGNDAMSGCIGVKNLVIEDGTNELILGYKSNTYYGLFRDCPIESLYLGRDLSYSTHSYNSFYPGYGAPFEYQDSLTVVTIGDSVTMIGDYAFDNCVNILKIFNKSNLPISKGSSTYGHVAYYAKAVYNNCSIEGDYVISTINGSKFVCDYRGTDSHLNLPNVNGIAEYAFYNKNAIKSINIPSSVRSIGNEAMSGCVGVKNLVIEDGANELILGYKSLSPYGGYYYGLFRDCPIDSLYLGRDLKYSTHNYYNSSYSGCGAPFEYQDSLTILIVGDSVTSIKEFAFYNCNGLREVTIPNNVASIGESAFRDCSNIRYLKLSESLQTIESNTFRGCSRLNAVVVPNSITAIKEYAFYGCKLTTLTISAGLVNIGNNAFNEKPAKTIWMTNTPPQGYAQASGMINYTSNETFSQLQNVKVYPYLSSLFEVGGVKYAIIKPSELNCDAIDCVYDTTVANINIGAIVSYRGKDMTVQNINDYACYRNEYIKSVDISNNGFVGTMAFYDCDGLETAVVKNIGDISGSAFQNCESMHTALIHNDGYIYNQAFEGNSALSSLVLGDSIRSIGQSAFSSCSGLEVVKVPSSVTSLGNSCFSGCTNLKSVTLSEGVITLGTHVLKDCMNLPDIYIPQSVNRISDYAFQGCSGLRNVIVGDRTSNLTLGSNGNSPLFVDCPLDSLYLGGKISYNTSSYYGYSPFYRNLTLRTVEVADVEDTIYDNEFYGCTHLQNVTLGDAVKQIGQWAFSGCSSIQSFSYGVSLKTIGREAFSDCTAMTTLVSEAAEPPTCGEQALDDISKWDCILYVPEASIAAYQEAEQWKDFFFINNNDGMVDDAEEGNRTKQFMLVDGTTYSNRHPFQTEQLTYQRNFTEVGWEPLYLPFSMSYDDWKDEYQVARINAFYQYDDDNDGKIDRSILEAIRVKEGTLQANYPYLIKAKTAGDKSIVLANAMIHPAESNSIDCSTVDTRFTFTGSYLPMSGSVLTSRNAYIMQGGRLQKTDDASTLVPFRWYLAVEDRNGYNAVAESRDFEVFCVDEASETGLEYMNAAEAEQDAVYSIDGRRVDGNNLKPGVYVVNGKKMFVR